MTCNDRVENITDIGMIIASPKYPSWYPRNKDCKYVIRLDGQQQIRLDFLLFDLESMSASTVKDYLKIYDGDNDMEPLIGYFYGSGFIEPLYSSGNALFIHFHSDSSFSRRGFKIKVTSGTFHYMMNICRY